MKVTSIEKYPGVWKVIAAKDEREFMFYCTPGGGLVHTCGISVRWIRADCRIFLFRKYCSQHAERIEPSLYAALQTYLQSQRVT